MNGLILELVGGPLRAMRRATFWWSLGLAALIAATISIWPAFKGSSGLSQAIDQLPAGVVQAFGLADFGTPAGFLRANLYDFFVPLLIVIAAVVLVNGQTASEEASGRLELYLAQPIDRRAVLLGRAIAALVALAVISVVLLIVQLGADAAVDLGIDTGYLVSTIALCALLGRPPRQPRGRDRRSAGAPVPRAGSRHRRRLRRMCRLLAVPYQRRARALATPFALGLGVRRQPARERNGPVALRGAGGAVGHPDGDRRVRGRPAGHLGSVTGAARNDRIHVEGRAKADAESPNWG
jgi:hypothetical protein